MRHLILSALLGLMLPALAAGAEKPPKKTRSAEEIIDAAPASDWRTPDPQDLLYMLLPTGMVIIELAPDFAPAHVGTIRLLAMAHFWDGLSIYRVQDNFVAQFGDPDAGNPAKARSLGKAAARLPAEFHRSNQGLTLTPLPNPDGWAFEAGFTGSLAVAVDPITRRAWPAHCYGTVGAGRGMEPDSSTGAELYVVIGQAPRQLDDNITVVGRVLVGMELLSGLPRGTGPMGMVENAAQRMLIRAVRLGSEVPEAARPALQVLRTDSKTFREALEARRNRTDEFYQRAAGHIDLCSVPVAVRAPPTP